MTVELNHTIVQSRDKESSARWLGDLLGLQVQPQFGPFIPVQTGNGVTLDYRDTDEEIAPQHYAFLVSEAEFDTIYSRLQQAGIACYADPARESTESINTRDGGRGTYFDDPNGHVMEILTRPYGSGEQRA
ncbi:VOC family protein [Bounagaea algeriensis]